MNLCLQSIRVKNFLSVKEQAVAFDRPGTTLVLGPNGAGKSALFVEPLLWLFYDTLNRTNSKRLSRKVKRTYRLEEVKEPTTVEAWLTVEGQPFYVSRSLEDGYTIISGAGDTTPYKAKSDGLAAVQNIIRLPLALFRSIAVMGQGFTERFTAYGDSAKSALIEDFIGAAEFERAQEDAKQAYGELSRAVASYEGRRQQLQQQLTVLEQQAGGTNLDSLYAKLSECQQQVEICRDTLPKLQSQQAAIDSERLQRKQSLDALQQEANHLFGSIGRLEGSVVETKSAIYKLGNLTHCPTCLQHVTAEAVAAGVAALNTKLAESEASLQELEQLVAANQDNVERCTLDLRQKEQELAECGQAIGAWQVRLTSLQADIAAVEGSIAAVSGVLGQLESIQAELSAIDATLSDYANRAARAGWWAEHFSVRGIRAQRLGSTLEEINGYLADYTAKLFDSEISVRLLPVKPQKTSDKPGASLEVISPSRCYELASGGQGRLIDLALAFAFRKFASTAANGWGCNFLVGDEIFDHLSRVPARKALEVLKGEAETVYLSTHSPDLQAFCDSVLHVRYEDEITVL